MRGHSQVPGQFEKSVESDHVMVGDYIGSIPHGIQVDILSLLPIKDAVRTSVLSKDWKENWTSIYNIDIDVREFLCVQLRENAEIFVDFVKRILAHKHSLKSFRINFSDCEEYIPSDIIDWISAALKRKVENLQITMWSEDFEKYPSEEPILHCSSLSCGSLESLKVAMPCTFKVVGHDCFAKLVILKLENIILESENDSDTMVLNFPVLKEIELELCIWSGMKVVEMHAPLLRRFESAVELDFGVDNYKIKIVGSNLEKLVTSLGPPENIILTSSSVVHASLQCHRPNFLHEYEHCGLQIRKLFRELSHVKKMELIGFFKAIAQTKQEIPLRRLTRLEELKVTCHLDIEGLIEVLHATPMLKFLRIEFGNKYYDRDYPDNYDYDVVESVPSCLVSHLEKVELDYSECVGKPNLNFAKLLLKNGALLKNVSVYGSLHFPTKEIVDELLTFPKGSTCLAIEGSTHYYGGNEI